MLDSVNLIQFQKAFRGSLSDNTFELKNTSSKIISQGGPEITFKYNFQAHKSIKLDD